MNQNGDITTRLRDFFERVEERFSVRLAYLFGSRAKGVAGRESDYDIAVLYSRPIAADDHYLLLHLLQVTLRGKVDLIDLSRAPIELVYNVIAARHCIYEKDRATRVEYEADTMSMYFDQLPVLRARRKDILDKTSEEDYERGVQRYREALRATRRMLAKTRTATGEAKG
ncbi:MAG: nucleotidyltransferase domain-containing protein [Candidatus Bipolaricaulota bacterium]|nr:nucleotidyltransferase domain-containing protein [Candidatus Bipolaricaulota bacterium]